MRLARKYGLYEGRPVTRSRLGAPPGAGPYAALGRMGISMKQGLFAAVALAAVALTVVLVPAASAAKPPPVAKVNVCHVDSAGAVRLKSVGANTLASHLAHGDALPGVMALPAGTTFSASSSWLEVQGTPDHAFDGNTAWAWNSGSYPVQWIEVNFGSPQPFSKITGLVAQTPNGTTNHNVTLDGAPAFNWTGHTVDSQLLTHTFATMQYAQTVRITTTVSSSWVAWWEIQLIGC